MAAALEDVDVGTLDLGRFRAVLDDDHLAELEDGMSRAQSLFRDRTLWHLNSTARGGGVAEMLLPLLAYARGAGVDARWLVVGGDDEFFRVTKRLHNRLHGAEGDGGPLAEAERAAYERALAPSADALLERVRDGDAVVLHDPQTAGLAPALRRRGVSVVWRCHIGCEEHNEHCRDGWAFLRPYVDAADALVFSRREYVWDGLDPDRVALIAPTIDVFSAKNQDLDDPAVAGILAAAGVCRDGAQGATEPHFRRMDGSEGRVGRRVEAHELRPLEAGEGYVLQVSRWDALKDPLGVIDGFAEHVAPHRGEHLVYAGPSVEAVADDPEGAEVLRNAVAHWEALAPEVRERVHLMLLPMADLEENAAIVNALQRGAAVVVQKSLAEGFGLTVAEAMWKARPVVASRVGGIQDQVQDGRSGVLLDDPRDLATFGAAVRGLLADDRYAAELGEAGRERVRGHFLGTQSLLAYVELLARLL